MMILVPRDKRPGAREFVRREWIQILVYTLVMFFGLYTAIQPLVSVDRAAPSWAASLLGAEFALAGLFLLIGMAKRRKSYRVVGLVTITAGLFTISGLIAIVGSASSFGATLLFAAFAFDCIKDLKNDRNARIQASQQELRGLLKEISNVMDRGGPQ